MKPETTDGLKALSCWANKGELRPRPDMNSRRPRIYSDKGISSDKGSYSAKAAATGTAVQRAKRLAATRRPA